MKHLRLFEEHINEIGDASAKPFKVQGPSPREILKDMLHAQETRRDNPIDWLDPDRVVKWSFSGDKGTDYEMEITWTVKKDIQIRLKPGKRKLAKKFAMRMNIGFYAKTKPLTGTEFNIDDEDDRERTTNLHEQYRVLATVIDKSIEVINEVTKEFKIDTIYIIPKADEGEEESINNRRGRFYLAYIKKAIKRLNDKVTASEDKYNGGFIIQGGHRYSTADRLEIRNESEESIEEYPLAQYIIEEILTDKLSYSNEKYQLVFDEFLEGLQKGLILNEQHFSQNNDLTGLVADLTTTENTLSYNWKKKHQIHTNLESERLKQAAHQSVYIFKLRVTENLILEKQQSLKNLESTESYESILEEIKELIKVRNIFADELGIIVTQ